VQMITTSAKFAELCKVAGEIAYHFALQPARIEPR
jgi:hypothetical protein